MRSSEADDDDDDSIDSWYSTNKPVEHHPIDEVVDTLDTPSDVTDPFSQASPVEHHPTASDKATCTTTLQSTHGRDQHTTGGQIYIWYNYYCMASFYVYYVAVSAVLTDAVQYGATNKRSNSRNLLISNGM